MNKFCSIFSQILQLFPRFMSIDCLKKIAERHARRFPW